MKKWIQKLLTKWGVNFLTKKIDNMKKSWKTTIIGVAILMGAVASAAVALLDGDPATSFNVNEILAALAGIGLMAGKDGDVTHSDNPAK